MKSELPKGLFEVCGLPMVELVGRSMLGCGIERPIVVVGHGGDAMRARLGDRYEYAFQAEQLGTGHAVQMCANLLAGQEGAVIIAPGDAPLLSSESLSKLACHHQSTGATCTIASVRMPDPTGYGRIVRNTSGQVVGIVEHKDATEEVRQSVDEVNTGVYCFDCQTLLRLLPQLNNQNAQGEYYLTDVISLVESEHGMVDAFLFEDSNEFMGVNDRWQLAQASAALRQTILRRHALAGVSIVDPASTYIGADVTIGVDTVVKPGTSISGLSAIGSGCQIGPFCDINDSEVGDGCTIVMSKLDHARMGTGSRCGPFAHLRSNARLGANVKVGNFVEIKNSELDEKAAAAHLTYIGDASVGAGTNVGAGTITCNYDGFGKHKTEIGANAFVGSNATLIAPVTIGDGAMIAAGSVINKDVPADALAFGRARQEVKEEWAAQWRRKKKAEKERSTES